MYSQCKKKIHLLQTFLYLRAYLLQSDIKYIQDWYTANFIKLNIGKSRVIVSLEKQIFLITLIQCVTLL